MRPTSTPFPSARLLALLVACSAAPVLQAADTGPPATQAVKADPMAEARAHIGDKRWPQAIDALKRVNATGNADWHNLMGYTLRKQATPDLDGAQRHYEEALKLDPRHRGALEYSGELYLMKGDLPRAEQQLATLSRVCTFGCEEYSDLKKAVERFKGNGNKFTPG